ncbi:hypothetical protein ACTNB9_08615 [Ligilactobacillus salivarius]|uniref:hypothetical protein n=1 Tax=Ligilactobacillus salivarius TaxID=1624 RepID=UPI003F8C94D8
MEEKVKRTLILPKILYERLEVKANEMGITVNSLILYHIYEMIDDYYDEYFFIILGLYDWCLVY